MRLVNRKHVETNAIDLEPVAANIDAGQFLLVGARQFAAPLRPHRLAGLLADADCDAYKRHKRSKRRKSHYGSSGCQYGIKAAASSSGHHRWCSRSDRSWW